MYFMTLTNTKLLNSDTKPNLGLILIWDIEGCYRIVVRTHKIQVILIYKMCRTNYLLTMHAMCSGILWGYL